MAGDGAKDRTVTEHSGLTCGPWCPNPWLGRLLSGGTADITGRIALLWGWPLSRALWDVHSIPRLHPLHVGSTLTPGQSKMSPDIASISWGGVGGCGRGGTLVENCQVKAIISCSKDRSSPRG